MSATVEGLQTIEGRGGILLPQINYEDDFKNYDQTKKVLELFRAFAVVNGLVEPYNNNPHRYQEPRGFEYEFVLPGTDTRDLAVVSGSRKEQSTVEIAKKRAEEPLFHTSRSRGYLKAREVHAIKVPPTQPGVFVTRISLAYNQHEGGWSMGGASVPSDAPSVLLDGKYIYVHDSDIEDGCRATFNTFYEILGEER